MKIVNPFKSHKKKDFVAYWDLKQFSQLLNKVQLAVIISS